MDGLGEELVAGKWVYPPNPLKGELLNCRGLYASVPPLGG